LLRSILAALCALVAFVIANSLSLKGYETIQSFKQLERIVPTKVIGAVDGETQLNGTVRAANAGALLTSPFTKNESLYYRYLEEIERKDSDGNSSWDTVRDESRAVAFVLDDGSGIANIAANQGIGAITWSIPNSYQIRKGSRRYSEWLIRPGDHISVVGFATVIRRLDGDQTTRVDFTSQGQYTPLISKAGEDAYRSELGLTATLYIWGGLSLIIVSMFALIFLLKIHRIITFLSITTSMTFIYLMALGLTGMSTNVISGAEFVRLQQHKTDLAIQEISREGGDETSLREMELNSNLALVETIFTQQISHFPENLYMALFVPTLPSGEYTLGTDQQLQLAARIEAFRPTKLSTQWAYLYALAPLGLFALCGYFGFRFAKIKRLIENIPTSKTKGVTYGLAEIKGRIQPIDDVTLNAPLTGTACVWYRYLVKEKQRTGKSSNWVTISDDTNHIYFMCEDREGQLKIDPSKAEVITRHKRTKRSGNMRYTQWMVKSTDSLYAIGSAKIDTQHPDKLMLAKDKRDGLLIISNRKEQEIMLYKSQKAMFALMLAMSAMFFTFIFMNGLAGDFSPTDYIAASLTGPLFLFLTVAVMHYNDIIFLRQRAERNWANIQVSLKKRQTLFPRLEKTLKAYITYEHRVLQALSKLRAANTKDLSKVKSAERYLRAEATVATHVKATVENYPKLKADKLTSDYMHRLEALETEVALIRQGFNDAVTQYNERIQSFPDLLLAKLFKFKKMKRLSFTHK